MEIEAARQAAKQKEMDEAERLRKLKAEKDLLAE